MCDYSVKQQNPSSVNFLAALCFGLREIRLPGEFRESVPGQARGVRHGGKLMDLIAGAGLFCGGFFMTFSLHLSVDSCADIDDHFRGSSTSWLGGSLVGGRGQGCVWASPGGAGSRTEVKRSQAEMSAAETLPKQHKQHNISAFHHEQ